MASAHGLRCRHWGSPLLVVAATVFTATALAQDPEAPSPCESYCSAEKPGTSVMEIRWPISAAPLGAAEVKARVAQQRVDVTVYEDGFDRGLFATLPTVAPAGRFRAAPRPAGATARVIPGIAKLVVTDVRTSSEPAGRRHLRLAAAATPGGGEALVIRVEGLEPGLNYFWKPPDLAPGGTPIMCQAATCPADRRAAPVSVRRPSPNP
jgi:hypothetical protein